METDSSLSDDDCDRQGSSVSESMAVVSDPRQSNGGRYLTCGESAGQGVVGDASDFAPATGRRRRQQNAPEAMMDCDDGAAVSKRSRGGSAGAAGREYCWLCTFCTHQKARHMSLFIVEQSPHMSNIHIAEQVKHEILSEYPHAQGARKRDIIRHIQFHMLDPNVRLATILRSLLSLAETVRLNMQTRDDEGVTVDVKQVDLYLRVINQIQNAYKTGNTRMLFSLADSMGLSDSRSLGNG